MGNLSHQQALEAVHADRLIRKQGYVEVPLSLFVAKIDVGMGAALPPVALYTMPRLGGATIVKEADEAFSPLALTALDNLWVREEDLSEIRGYAERQIVAELSPSMPVDVQERTRIERMETLRRSAITVTSDLFTDPSPKNISRSTRVVGSFVYVLMRDPKAYSLLLKLGSHDPYTVQHSVGTAVNSIILARKIGITSDQELLDVGLGGLLHDIGKVNVKKEIINKQSALDELEWEEMRQHSGEGYELVKDRTDLSDRTKLAILQHHEDKNGTGYPNRLQWSDVDIYAKIVSLADIFNALTTDRTYSKARTAFEALTFIREKLAHKVDDELFKNFVMVYGGKL